MRVWRANGVGEGKVIPYSNFPLKGVVELPFFDKTSDVAISDLSFSDLTPRRRPDAECTGGTFASAEYNKTEDDTLFTCPEDGRYVQKCTQQKWQKWQSFANNNLEANANEKTRGPPCKAGEFGESGKNGKLVKIADNNLEANANEKARVPPCKTGESGKNAKLVKIADNNLEANANEKTRGPPCKAGNVGEFGESGKNGKLVKIADNNLEANANEKTRGPPCKAGEFGESGKNGKLVKIADNSLEANANEKTRGHP